MTILKNKVALVTGSVRGIGKAIAARYGSLDANIVVNYSTDGKRAQALLQSRFRQTSRKWLILTAYSLLPWINSAISTLSLRMQVLNW